ncbi:post-transcriptional regulator [Ornithinibacillus salinisoli]|uniref:Post-transcriptional regulator n=1 Tax=Ornithinibacillus salinisoli TaxID=1848459 RepID=A0ABW4W332_9BACI
MELVKSVEEWKEMLQPVLESKTQEFLMMGYSKATNDDIWNCLVKKVWKGHPSKRLYEVVQDILHLGSNIYMSYLTVNAYQDDDLMASIAALTEGEERE